MIGGSGTDLPHRPGPNCIAGCEGGDTISLSGQAGLDFFSQNSLGWPRGDINAFGPFLTLQNGFALNIPITYVFPITATVDFAVYTPGAISPDYSAPGPLIGTFQGTGSGTITFVLLPDGIDPRNGNTVFDERSIRYDWTAQIPEPASMILVLIGLSLVALMRNRNRAALIPPTMMKSRFPEYISTSTSTR